MAELTHDRGSKLKLKQYIRSVRDIATPDEQLRSLDSRFYEIIRNRTIARLTRKGLAIEDAEDFAIIAFYHVIETDRRLVSFKGRSRAFPKYLAKIAYNRFLDHVKSLERERSREQEHAPTGRPAEKLSNGHSFAYCLVIEELEKLSLIDQTIIQLRRMNIANNWAKSVSEELQRKPYNIKITEQNIRVKFSRACNRIHSALKNRGDPRLDFLFRYEDRGSGTKP